MSGWHSFVRVDAPEALAVPRRVTRKLADVQEVLPQTKDVPIDEVERAVTAVAEAGDEIADAASAAAQSAQRVPLGFVDVLTAPLKAFLVLELQRSYRRWKHLNLPNWQTQLADWRAANPGAPEPPQFTPDSRVSYAAQLEEWAESMHGWSLADDVTVTAPVPRRLPIDYATGTRSGRPHELLKILFGDGYRAALRGTGGRAPRLQPAALWPRLVACVWPPPDAQAVPRMRQLLQLAQADPDIAPTGLLSAVRAVAEKTQVNQDPAYLNRAAILIRDLAARHAPNGDIAQLTDEGLLALMGKPMSVDEFIHRSLLGLDMMAAEADLIGPELFDKLLEVEGIESFLAMVLQKSGYEHGYTFEVFLVLRELSSAPVPDPSKLWMQIVLGGKQGPDIGRVLGTGDARRVQLIQAKSYRSLSKLLSPTDTGEIWRQLRSDLLRLKAEGLKVKGPDGTELPIDRTIEFDIDWWHLRSTSLDIEGIDPKELHALNSSSPALSLAFYDQYVHKKALELQELLDSPEFRAELGLAADDPGFVLDINVIDRILPD